MTLEMAYIAHSIVDPPSIETLNEVLRDFDNPSKRLVSIAVSPARYEQITAQVPHSSQTPTSGARLIIRQGLPNDRFVCTYADGHSVTHAFRQGEKR